MKRLFLVLASMASIASTFAQDVIVKRDGEEIQCRILEVSTNKVKYKQWKNQDGPTFVEKKTDVLMLKYENGQKEVISYTAPVGASQIEDPVVAETPVDSAALGDTMPISNDFLEYARKEESGLFMWGRPLSVLQAHTILGKDWTDFTRAHKNERVGRSLIIGGGALIIGGGVFTAVHIAAVKDYNDKKSAYENHVADANSKYQAEVTKLNNSINSANTKLLDAKNVMNIAQNALTNATEDYNNAMTEYEYVKKQKLLGEATDNMMANALNKLNEAESKKNDAQSAYNKSKTGVEQAEAGIVAASNDYNDLIQNSTTYYNENCYDASYKDKMTDAEHFKKVTLAPMIGCYASGAALLIWGIIKERRAHDKINSIVTRLNAEDAYPGEIQQESRRKPEFDMESRSNGLAFLLKF